MSPHTARPVNTSSGPTGYSLPLSPSGRSSMITPPPWHFSGDVIMVDYRVDPDAVRAFLPPGLTLGPNPGAAAAVFADWQWCSDSGAELSTPERSQFKEFLLLLECAHEGRTMVRCPYAWVDQPVPMARGWVQGMPKQLGTIYQTRALPVGRAGTRKGTGERFHGSLSVFGERVARAEVACVEEVAELPSLHAVPLAHTRIFPPWLSDERPLEQLVASEVTDIETSRIWAGPADLELWREGLDADFGTLTPVEVGRGYVFSYAETLRGGRLLGGR
ncbi:enduracididine biosynthesis enzyme MppR [Actinoalloteichus sp. AHMU CJ021]|uniref:enduracididine biosynthesis enzyme MppR n=1 Tax=Actinoalloteichus TaxID=65496 RepID=UPI0004AA69F5|nr:enduracididine biosynthesis enzyme MppR [Actinoalloteichus caeruleus]AUS77184.1 enduracididine biosynthesis enzyme MppR [Actinoalloteichus sp. AHMU CJ021]